MREGPRNRASEYQSQAHKVPKNLLLLGKNLVARKPPVRRVVEVRVPVPRIAAEANDVLETAGIEPALREAQHPVRALVVGVGAAPANALVEHGGLHGRGHCLHGGDRFLPGERLPDLHRTDTLDGDIGVHTREALAGDVVVPVRAVELGAEKRHRGRRQGSEEFPHLHHHRTDVRVLGVEPCEDGFRIATSLRDGDRETVED